MKADRKILQLAARQHGVVARQQLLAAGVHSRSIEWRLAAGRLQPLHAGVYRAGAVAAQYEREMAALLASGRGAALSHRTAAALLSLPPCAAGVRVDVTVPHRRRRVAGIQHHRVPLQPGETTRVGVLRVTTAARTLLDLAAVLGDDDLERALAHALRARLTTAAKLRMLLGRHPRRRGRRRLLLLLESTGGPALTRSRLEASFLALMRRARLALPQTNVRLHGFEVDFLWRTQRLVVEVDGFAFHAARLAFENDRRRDTVLTLAGYRVLRVSWRHVTETPEAVAAAIAQALMLSGRQHA